MSKYALIERCSDASYWYSDKVGQMFPLVRFGDTESYVRTGDSYDTGNYIQNVDFKLFESSGVKSMKGDRV